VVLLELVRRLMLAAGIAGFFTLALTTVPALLLVAPVDFAAEMAQKYRFKPEPRLKGVMELGKEYIQKTWNSGMAMALSPRRWGLPPHWSSPGAVIAGPRSFQAVPGLPFSGARGPARE
jgi:hypothetical protein